MEHKAIVYAVGLVALSCCAPADMLIADVELDVNLQHPTGITHGWALSGAGQFADGTPMPCACNTDATRLHYLLTC